MLEKVGGNGNSMLSEQIVAIADNFLEYECLATNQHQNFVSAFTKKDQFVEKKDFILRIRFIGYFIFIPVFIF